MTTKHSGKQTPSLTWTELLTLQNKPKEKKKKLEETDSKAKKKQDKKLYACVRM